MNQLATNVCGWNVIVRVKKFLEVLLLTMMFRQPDREYFVTISNSGTIKFIQAPVIQRVDSNIYWINPCSLPKLPCILMFAYFSVVCSLINISSYHLPPPSRSTFNCSRVANHFSYDISPLFPYSPKPLRAPHFTNERL